MKNFSWLLLLCVVISSSRCVTQCGPQNQLLVNSMGRLGPLKHTGNIENVKSATITGDVGVKIVVENFSSKILTDPAGHNVCGYKDQHFGSVNEVKGKSKDVFIFHNKKHIWKGSCGFASWKIKDPMSKKTRQPLLALTWNLEYQCTASSIELSLTLNGTETEDRSAFYSKYHQSHRKWRNKQCGLDDKRRMMLLGSKEAGLWTRVVLEPGCTPVVRLQLLEYDTGESSWLLTFGGIVVTGVLAVIGAATIFLIIFTILKQFKLMLVSSEMKLNDLETDGPVQASCPPLSRSSTSQDSLKILMEEEERRIDHELDELTSADAKSLVLNLERRPVTLEEFCPRDGRVGYNGTIKSGRSEKRISIFTIFTD